MLVSLLAACSSPPREVLDGAVDTRTFSLSLNARSTAACLADWKLGPGEYDVLSNSYSRDATVTLAERLTRRDKFRPYAARIRVYRIDIRRTKKNIFGGHSKDDYLCLVDTTQNDLFLSSLKVIGTSVQKLDANTAALQAWAAMSGEKLSPVEFIGL
ncbi:hypothetical protein RDV64_02925 [Acuticoccus sp. MNP-M23]|uniref:hypothetical protein n=1 Tax=Acuticoccus sp. MNP-M23 TaxID=3072793 RepID=UPI0028165D56|nr:hypothetical protein [Acuticoccus sp. MNP-M23]WMS43372.1 hypothetical protein RDV64_02925 [Acuticoccus sp. MNP-M23]